MCKVCHGESQHLFTNFLHQTEQNWWHHHITIYLGPSYSRTWPVVMSLLGVGVVLGLCFLGFVVDGIVVGAAVVTTSVLLPVIQNSSSAKFSRNTFQSYNTPKWSIFSTQVLLVQSLISWFWSFGAFFPGFQSGVVLHCVLHFVIWAQSPLVLYLPNILSAYCQTLFTPRCFQ